MVLLMAQINTLQLVYTITEWLIPQTALLGVMLVYLEFLLRDLDSVIYADNKFVAVAIVTADSDSTPRAMYSTGWS